MQAAAAGQFDVWNIFLDKSVGQLGLNFSLKAGRGIGHKPEDLQQSVAQEQVHEHSAAPVHSPHHEATGPQHAQHALIQRQGQSDSHSTLAHKQGMYLYCIALCEQRTCLFDGRQLCHCSASCDCWPL